MFLRKQATWVLITPVLCLFSSFACMKTPPTDPRAELVGSLKDARLEGFYFETMDADVQQIAAMTNGAIREPIKMDADGSVVLRYTRVHDKKTNTTTTYKTEAIRSGDQITLQVTDIASGASALKQTADFPAPPAPAAAGGCGGTFPPFNSLADCTCSLRASLLVEANRTCTPQSAPAICCLNGNLISVHLFVMPTNLICQLDALANFADLLFFRD